ncbi:MAG: hypothetical protein JXQ66_04460 [Campylobacterales bacterium]|nr:hypothetical protein [Campylobacterales bacterium]
MDIQASGNSVTITGNIKSISDFQTIKNILEPMAATHNNITINIVDSLSITSSVVGYFNKLVLKDKVKIDMNIGNIQLMDLLRDLNLASVFNAKKI